MNRTWIASVTAEALGTGALVCVVVGSGIAAASLSDDVGVQLLANSFATALGLAVLIAALGPISGAHLNPAVTLIDSFRRRQSGTGRVTRVAGYVVAQLTGAVGGGVLANAMFDVPQGLSITVREGFGIFLGEVVATAGLIVVVALAAHHGAGRAVALWVAAYIGSAYWFTSSTSFANPAVTVGRMFTDTFAGISPASAVPFVLAQLVGAAIGLLVVTVLTMPDIRASTTAVASTPTPTT
ncbi:aquaporin [Microbacterium sp. HMH0099]|uniref:aquaporin n=1 Tax=Microbacterium sp. HMH0099 TaxID=3414026 RepID=UPI003BF726F5